MAAQAVDSTVLHLDGIPGDRERALIVRSGHTRQSKTYRGKEQHLLHTTNDVSQAIRIADAVGVQVEVTNAQAHYFDCAPISLIFDCWIAEVEEALGRALDPLRWRPNIYARAAHGFALKEADLVGQIIDIGEAQLLVRQPISRCVTTTYDVETGERDHRVLRYVAQARAAILGIYCEVKSIGKVGVGDDLLTSVGACRSTPR